MHRVYKVVYKVYMNKCANKNEGKQALKFKQIDLIAKFKEI